MAEQRELQRMVLELRMLQERAAQLERQAETFRALLEESRNASKALEAIASSAAPAVLFPLGAGVMVKATPTDSRKVFFEAGSGVVLEKPAAEVAGLLAERAEKLLQAVETTQREFQQVSARIEELREALLEAQRGK